MKKYVCSICGYIYDEQIETVKFVDLPENWVCPLCGAPKGAFNLIVEANNDNANDKQVADVKTKSSNIKSDRPLSNAELNVLCANLAKGCEKQYKATEAALFSEIAEFYKKHSDNANGSIDEISKRLNDDLASNFPNAFSQAKTDEDRGALRVLTWSEKVSKIVDSLIARYKKEGVSFLQNSKIFVCEICGFIYIGDDAPEICPICKVPKFKIHEVGRV
ncbi:MAG: rubredoxin [Clostridia bacterium]